MKKVLIFAVSMLLVATACFAQRPVQQAKKVTNNTTVQQVRQGRDNTGVRTTATQTQSYTYTISVMDIPNVTVSDAVFQLTYVKPDRIKVMLQQPIDKLTYYVYDANNTAITKGDMKGTSLCIDFKNYQPGEYRIQFLCEKDSQKNYKITKR